MPGTNIAMLQTVANGLQELKDEVVFIGGAVAELYASDPAASDIPGFSNRWYHEGIENKIVKTLSNGNPIFLFPPEYYLAAKFDAQLDWGGNVLRQRRDFGRLYTFWKIVQQFWMILVKQTNPSKTI